MYLWQTVKLYFFSAFAVIKKNICKKETWQIWLLTMNVLMVNVLWGDESECASYHRFVGFYMATPDDTTTFTRYPLQHALWSGLITF